MDDLELITEHCDGIFEEHELKDIPYWILKGSCIIFENENGDFIGYGMFNRTLEERNWYDIGMYVKPEMRKRGYGTYIIDRMAEHVKDLGGIPTAGCAFDNKGSKRTLERAGFVSKHVMVEFGF
jgi:GNAT superfamily N-acetyltransferase